jgi:DNA repair photolyase
MRRVDNPPNPYAATELLRDEPPPPAELEVYEERCKEALAKNESPDIGFDYSLNPYRGCFHACAYCYARPSHQYLGFGAGTDFDRRIVVKVNVAERLKATFDRPGWRGEAIVFSGNTDCYQPLEATYGLTRACLEVCAAYRNPASIITKGVLVRRDRDLLAELAREAGCKVHVSVAFARDEDARRIEPFASPPSKRFETVRLLREAGVPVGVGLAPIIPGLNDAQIPEILARAADAGAESAFLGLLRLSREVLPVFTERLEEAYPLRTKKVADALREMRGGAMNDARFGARMRGQGPRWALVEALFESSLRRYGLDGGRGSDERAPSRGPAASDGPSPFRRPTAQLGLFDERPRK